MNMTLSIDGAWGPIRASLDAWPDHAYVIWLTYTVEPSKELLDYLCARQFRLSILAHHPKSDTEGHPVKLKVETWDLLSEYHPHTARGLRGLPRNGALLDGSQSRMHAKLIAVAGRESGTWQPVGAATRRGRALPNDLASSPVFLSPSSG